MKKILLIGGSGYIGSRISKYLAENGNFDGTLYFIYQPDEENCLGAKTMIDEGLFTKFSIDELK